MSRVQPAASAIGSKGVPIPFPKATIRGPWMSRKKGATPYLEHSQHHVCRIVRSLGRRLQEVSNPGTNIEQYEVYHFL
jgi:hypothetical protein